jgi:hypothetical protein
MHFAGGERMHRSFAAKSAAQDDNIASDFFVPFVVRLGHYRKMREFDNSILDSVPYTHVRIFQP